MELCPVEEQSLFRRRLCTAAPRSLECDLHIPPPSQSSDSELDPDAFKTKPDVKEWISKTALKISSRRPCLTFSPSFLLSPICFSPVLIDDGLVSPFACIKQLISTPKSTPDIPTKSSSDSTTSSIFTFDTIDVGDFSPSTPLNSSRRLCAIPEDRELTTIDIEIASDSIQNQIFEFRKADIPSAPPKSPSIAIATKSKKNSIQKNHTYEEKPEDSKNNRQNFTHANKKKYKKDSCQKKGEEKKSGGATLEKGFAVKRRSGNSMFLSMVSR